MASPSPKKSRYGTKRALSSALVALILFTLTWAGRADAVIETPYKAFHGMNTFEQDGEQVQALRVAGYLTVRSWSATQIGARLRLAGSFAASDVVDLLEQELAKVRVVSFVPGAELVIPLGTNQMIRPFLDLGVGSNDFTKSASFLGAAGLRSELIFVPGEFLIGLEPGFQASLDTFRNRSNQIVINPFVTVNARRTLGFEMGGHTPDLGVYVETGYDFQTLEFTSVHTDSDRIQSKYEAGFGFGFSVSRPKIGPVPVPRLRIGYRFGDLKGLRVRIGGDWLTAVVR